MFVVNIFVNLSCKFSHTIILSMLTRSTNVSSKKDNPWYKNIKGEYLKKPHYIGGPRLSLYTIMYA